MFEKVIILIDNIKDFTNFICKIDLKIILREAIVFEF